MEIENIQKLENATAVGAPVSTTHSIVGGVPGAGIAAGGFGIANWDQLMLIAAAWIIPVPAAGIMAALLFFTIRGMMLPWVNLRCRQPLV